mmetsp:Transcript_420/g.534  ORF Transcript_420/g.534 Transcript_420/m.534 type:complete len:81 (-) Transcript_420:1420-1662(-)
MGVMEPSLIGVSIPECKHEFDEATSLSHALKSAAPDFDDRPARLKEHGLRIYHTTESLGFAERETLRLKPFTTEWGQSNE